MRASATVAIVSLFIITAGASYAAGMTREQAREQARQQCRKELWGHAGGDPGGSRTAVVFRGCMHDKIQRLIAQ